MSETIARRVLDLQEGLARAGDDREFFKELLALFLEDARERLGELNEAIDAGDAQRAASAAHGIKGAAANLAATASRDLAASIEARARGGETQSLRPDVAELEAAVDAVADFESGFAP